MTEAILDARNLHKAFGGLRAVDGVSFAVPRGSVKAIIGPNGAGKTTLINLISGLDRPDTGEVWFAGRPVNRLPPHEIVRLGMARTFQNLKLFPDMSVIENVMTGRHSRTRAGLLTAVLRGPRSRAEEREIEAHSARLLAEVGLERHAHERAGDLPFGKQRLLEIARALATEPSLLLLDEPAAGLNAVEAAELGRLILQIRGSGVTTLLVEHHMELVMKISEEIMVLNFGRKLAEGTPTKIQSDRTFIEAYLGDEQSLTQDLRA
jgi:ABC-type branched-subunit amino acid transport system ATPase component